jgi:hypothetical protein
MKPTPEIEVTYLGTRLKVRYDYDPGESQRFDAKAGVGSPGSDPCVEILEIHVHDDQWLCASCLNDEAREAIEEALMEKIAEMEMERDQERADALYDQFKEDRYGPADILTD